LGFFKYFDFFASSLQSLFGLFGLSPDPTYLNIILPVGISFYTFQTMSYTIDIYRKEIEPTRKFFDFALFVSFFPQLVAGPIERAKNLLPQILSPRTLSLDKFYEGAFLIFWGLFLKVFIADNLASIVDPVFGGGAPYNGVKVLLASYAFAFQIFCDFAGYSSIARGLGKCMGFEIMVNFRVPYFSASPREFWQRWHISLSTWLRDYLYISLGGNRKGSLTTYRNLSITMILGGLWHGASWTFIVWGVYHGVLLIVARLLEPLFGAIATAKRQKIMKATFPLRVVIMFHLVVIGWLFFRSESITQAYEMLQGLVLNFTFTSPGALVSISLSIFSHAIILLIVQGVQYWKNDLLIIRKSHVVVRALFYFVCTYLLIVYGASSGQEFIYFQF
jgi:D-alanyl-lipoteichoic acid acyltransferase DltB (MBOAT superfamily)